MRLIGVVRVFGTLIRIYERKMECSSSCPLPCDYFDSESLLFFSPGPLTSLCSQSVPPGYLRPSMGSAVWAPVVRYFSPWTSHWSPAGRPSKAMPDRAEPGIHHGPGDRRCPGIRLPCTRWLGHFEGSESYNFSFLATVKIVINSMSNGLTQKYKTNYRLSTWFTKNSINPGD